MADEFDEQPETMTIQEYIEEMEEQEMAVDMVLGGDEGKECTYSKGYMKRQAVFSCLTCVPDGNAGVCTACSISCHDGHEIVELWTKRNFRCDCGNSKFGSFYCKLSANKDPENEKNSYNQNFKGSYCNCGRPYPDPEAEEQEEMIQCCICEDWFHESHLGFDPSKEIPRNEGGVPLYDELICRHCAVTCSFLKLYPANIFVALKQKNVSINDNKENVRDCGSVSADPMKNENGVPDSLSLINCSSTHSDSKSEHNVDNSLEENTAGGLDAEKTNTCRVDMSSNSTCTLGVDINAMQFIAEEAQAMILSKGWREFLCRCVTCSGFYTKMGVGYLIDKEDTIEEYEKMAKQKREENLQRQEGDGMNFLNGLGHVQKVEILSAIDDMKTELGSFLGSFDTSQAVTPEDVRVFFENLSKKKRRRLQ